MAWKVEEALMVAVTSKDPTVLIYVALIVACYGGVRVKHFKRSVPVRFEDGWLVCYCTRGKQKHNQKGFYWGICTRLVSNSSFDWGPVVLEAWDDKVEALDKQEPGLVFHLETFEQFSNAAVNDVFRTVVREIVVGGNPTAYSLRRVPLTVAVRMLFTPFLRLALAD